MSTTAWIVIAIAAVIAIAVALVLLPRARQRRRLRRERLGERAGGHRQEASLHSSKADELTAEVEAKRSQAAEASEEAERAERVAEHAAGERLDSLG